jgi:hypothetical protein
VESRRALYVWSAVRASQEQKWLLAHAQEGVAPGCAIYRAQCREEGLQKALVVVVMVCSDRSTGKREQVLC